MFVYMENVRAQLIADKPKPLWLIHLPGGGEWFRPPFDQTELLSRLNSNLVLCEFRGISVNRLNFVLRNGIDVEPTDGVIFANDLNTAWQYGGWPKLVLALDTVQLQRTFKQVSSDTSPDELEKIRRSYPTVVKSTDGTKLWLTRFKEGNPRIGTPYELTHAWWIEGDPFEALQAIMLFARPEDEPTVAAHVKLLATSG